MAITTITYELHLEDGTKKQYSFEIDDGTWTVIHKAGQTFPEWTKLENKKCSHCPLKSEKFDHCPMAANIANIVEDFKNLVSYATVTVGVKTPTRTYLKKIPLQDALSSVFDLAALASGCPHTDFMKPQSRFHIPFQSIDELVTRTASFYLLQQHLKSKKGSAQTDPALKHLEEQCTSLQKVQQGMIERIRNLGSGDANNNAFNTLASLSSLLTMAISKGLSRVEPFFK